MHRFALVAVCSATLGLTLGTRRAILPVSLANDNTAPSGHVQNGVLELSLEAKLSEWHPDGDSLPGMAVEAFSEPGKPPQIPGPLIRVRLGTELHLAVRNSLERDTLTYFVEIAGTSDSVVIPPGTTGELRVRPTRAGNFFYRATTSGFLGRNFRVAGLLAGAIVIDPAGTTRAPRDRVFVIQLAADGQIPGSPGIPIYNRSVWVINGRSWPATERLDATVGDTLHWRVINVTIDQHPMHLHGFYYTVDAFEGTPAVIDTKGPPGRRVVTERLTAFTTMSMTWIPERAGNWLFHCHFQDHLVPHGPLGGPAPAAGVMRIAGWTASHPANATKNHAMTGMGGLVLGVTVHPRRGARTAAIPASRRRLRLVATMDPAFPDAEPSLHFLLEDPRNAVRHPAPVTGLSDPISLIRGEPVSIMVVNRMHEATSVHWHGIELESFFDGVAGFSGGARLAPVIMPGDSFEARMTPPRAGTFIYHSHVDDLRQHKAGLVGALIVRDAPVRDPGSELTFLFKTARRRNPVSGYEVNGTNTPDTLVLRMGKPYRVRLITIQAGQPTITPTITARPDSVFSLATDSLLVLWTPMAKDGADLPAALRVPHPRVSRWGWVRPTTSSSRRLRGETSGWSGESARDWLCARRSGWSREVTDGMPLGASCHLTSVCCGRPLSSRVPSLRCAAAAEAQSR